MNLHTLDTFECNVESQFKNALDILLKSPQSWNKRILGAELVPQNLFDDASRTFSWKLYFKAGVFSEESIDIDSKGQGWTVTFKSTDKGPYLIFEWTPDGMVNILGKMTSKMVEKFQSLSQNSDLCSSIQSLKLVSIKSYLKKYSELKSKYYNSIKSNWLERTDPQKFIPEDIGIAAYLLCLWESENVSKGITRKQRFLDLGCGNGLLVYILVKEGYPGKGIDIRNRKIWTQMFDEIDLVEETLIPSLESNYPEYDWLIGNHTDELTPWIPIIAANSSPTCSFFLLPCCPFEFYCKFRRRDTKIGAYSDYLEYVQEIIDKSGFKVQKDRLRIPSTKRICFVGQDRKEKVWEIQKRYIFEMIQAESSNTFVPREKIEKVRNCTQVDKLIIHEIVKQIVQLLLGQKYEGNWNKGLTLSLSDIARNVPNDCLQKLKNECGGLQTLIKNHHYIFYISKGYVRLRHPVKDLPKSLPKNVKTKLCWFYNNHPQGCPASNETCLWIHEKEKIVEKKRMKLSVLDVSKQI